MKRNIGHLCHDEPREPQKSHKANKELEGGLNDANHKQELLSPNADNDPSNKAGLEASFLPTGTIQASSDTTQVAGNPALPQQTMQGGVSGTNANGDLGNGPQQCEYCIR